MNKRFNDDRDARMLDDERDGPVRNDAEHDGKTDDDPTRAGDSEIPNQRENIPPVGVLPEDDDRLVAGGPPAYGERPADEHGTQPVSAPEAYPAGTGTPHNGPGPVRSHDVYGERDTFDEDVGALPEDTPGEVRKEVEPDAVHPTGVPGETAEDLFPHDVADVQRRWHDVQAAFVDDPRAAVEHADELLGEVVTTMTEALNSRTGRLQDTWKNSGESDTEQLRLALRDYRTLLERLLQMSDHGTR
ncbi:hypothetical protein [Streptosporangium sp. KLBMP 9127]|nr:hypothetical protein [Streptosporangium sp. KLBMP 9127]